MGGFSFELIECVFRSCCFLRGNIEFSRVGKRGFIREVNFLSYRVFSRKVCCRVKFIRRWFFLRL